MLITHCCVLRLLMETETTLEGPAYRAKVR